MSTQAAPAQVRPGRRRSDQPPFLALSVDTSRVIVRDPVSSFPTALLCLCPPFHREDPALPSWRKTSSRISQPLRRLLSRDDLAAPFFLLNLFVFGLPAPWMSEDEARALQPIPVFVVLLPQVDDASKGASCPLRGGA